MSERTIHAGGARGTGQGARQANAVPFVGAVAALAAGALVAIAAAFGVPGDVHWPEALGFLALLAAAEYLIVRFEYRGETMALSLFEAVLAPAVVVLPPIDVVILVALTQVIAGLSHRIRPVKIAFNTAQWTLAAAGGVAVYHALASGTVTSGRTVGAIIAAMTSVALLNTVLFVGLMRVVQSQTARTVAANLAPSILAGWTVNTAFGVLFVFATQTTAAIPLLLVPLLALHRAYREHAAAVADRTRLSRLHRALLALTEPLDPNETIERFLVEVRDCFDAETAELTMLAPGGRSVHRLRAEGRSRRMIETGDVRSLAAALLERGEPARVTLASRDLELAGLLRDEGWRECIAAPLIADGQVLGILCAYDRSGLEGFEEAETAVLQALANEAAGMIRRAALLEEILEERRKLSEIVTLASDGIMTVGADGTVQTWNPGMEEITGYGAGEMVGSRLLGSLRPVDVDDRDVILERWADTPEDPPVDMRIVDRNGETRWLSCTYNKVAEPDGRPRIMIVVARDVTKLREIEQLKDDFIATVSHELRTPLTPIRGWATTLMNRGDDLGPQERRIAAEAIQRQAENLERLITNLLQASRIEPGGGVDRDAIVDANAAVRRVIDEYRATQPGREIRLEGEPGRCLARGSDLWIERIVSNLLSNALKYAPEDEPVDVRIRRHDGTVEIAVTDRGPGISPRDADAVFERFRRLGNASTRAQGGTGLGLYIARQLARSIGGTVTVESVLGKGATFTLRLRGSGHLAAVG